MFVFRNGREGERGGARVSKPQIMIQGTSDSERMNSHSHGFHFTEGYLICFLRLSLCDNDVIVVKWKRGEY